MNSRFEGAMFVLFGTMVLMLKHRLGVDDEAGGHANFE